MLLFLLLQTLQKHALDFFLRKPFVLHGAIHVKLLAGLFFGIFQPVKQLLRELVRQFHILEKFQKSPVEFIKIRLAFDQHAPAEVIKPRKGGAVQPLVQCLNQRHPFIQRNFQPACAQKVKKRSKHSLSPAYFKYRFMVSMSSFFFSRTPANGTAFLILSGATPPSSSACIQSITSEVLGFFWIL